MKASELIELLKKEIEKGGDDDVYVFTDADKTIEEMRIWLPMSTETAIGMDEKNEAKGMVIIKCKVRP